MMSLHQFPLRYDRVWRFLLTSVRAGRETAERTG